MDACSPWTPVTPGGPGGRGGEGREDRRGGLDPRDSSRWPAPPRGSSISTAARPCRGSPTATSTWRVTAAAPWKRWNAGTCTTRGSIPSPRSCPASGSGRHPRRRDSGSSRQAARCRTGLARAPAPTRAEAATPPRPGAPDLISFCAHVVIAQHPGRPRGRASARDAPQPAGRHDEEDRATGRTQKRQLQEQGADFLVQAPRRPRFGPAGLAGAASP